MKYKCAMIQDLLPLYADKVVSRESEKAIKQHLLECDECRRLYESMTEKKETSNDITYHDVGDFNILSKKIKRRRWIIVGIITVVVALSIGWFSDALPKVVVKKLSDNYLAKKGELKELEFEFTEYSPAHDCYFAHYEDEHGDFRNIGVYYRWFPMDVYFDSEYPG